MQPGTFYPYIVEISALPPQERHAAYAALHTRVLHPYLDAVRRITAEQAQQPVNMGDDTRTLAQLTGHMAEWDRFSLLGVSDMLIGLEVPRTIVNTNGYVALDGRVLDFATVDDFNAYQAEQHRSWAWGDLQALAIDTATTLHALFTQPHLLTAERLERTKNYHYTLPDGSLIEPLRMGWHLWILTIEHMAVDHVREFGIEEN